MLQAAVLNTARQAVHLALQDRQEPFALAAGDIITQASKRGVLLSGMTVLGVRNAAKKELEIRAQLAWQAWLRALSTQASVSITDLRAFLLSEIERLLDTESQDVLAKVLEVQNMMQGMGGETPQAFFPNSRDRAMERVASEVDYAILEATSKHAQGETTAKFNFYGQVGVVQRALLPARR